MLHLISKRKPIHKFQKYIFLSFFFLLFCFTNCAQKITPPRPLPKKQVNSETPAFQKGVCLAHSWRGGDSGYGSKACDQTLKYLQSIGVQWISLTPFGYMNSLHNPKIRESWASPENAETDRRLKKTIFQARAQGIKIMLKPHLWIKGGAWRGDISFSSPKQWKKFFQEYSRFIFHYADFARENHIKFLCIGVELKSASHRFPKEWKKMISEIKKRYSGKLTYAANWDETKSVIFWKSLDYIGIQAFFPLANKKEKGEKKIREGAQKWNRTLQSLSKRYNKKIIFTEIGYRSVSDPWIKPWEWPERAEQEPIDEKAQALGYKVFMEEIGTKPYSAGVYWWKIFTGSAKDYEGKKGFSFRGKLAEKEVKKFFKP